MGGKKNGFVTLQRQQNILQTSPFFFFFSSEGAEPVMLVRSGLKRGREK